MSVAVYGKTPVRGDFIDRRAPDDFVERWHEWCAGGLALAKETLGGRYAEFYSCAPIWRFALDAGICGAAPAIGIMSPSADSVGRFFPLTLFSLGATEIGSAQSLLANLDWFDDAERLILQIFGAKADLDIFFAAADAIAPPEFVEKSPPLAGDSVFSDARRGLTGLFANFIGQSARAAFWTADGIVGQGGDKFGALLLREALPAHADWPLLIGATTLGGALSDV